VQRGVDAVLCPYGFRRDAPTRLANQEHAFDEWIRQNLWRRDSFQICYRGGRTPDDFAATVSMALLPLEGERIPLDSGDVAYLTQRSGVFVWYGRSGKSERELIAMLVEDAVKVLGWFDRAADPLLALEAIERKKERERWTHPARFNKIASALREIETRVTERADPSRSKYVERPQPVGLIDNLLDPTVVVCRVRRESEGRLSIFLRGTNSRIAHQLRDISLSRELAVLLGASPPAEFSAQPSRDDAEQRIVWGTNGIAIPCESELMISVPCTQPLAAMGIIELGIDSFDSIAKLSRTVAVELPEVDASSA
jgi:hypothetical protein